MKKSSFTIILFLLCLFNMNANSGNEKNPNLEVFTSEGYKYDSFTTDSGRKVSLIFIKHGSLAIDIDGALIYIDPVTIFGNDFSVLPKADMIFVTHEHHDHLDLKAIEQLSSEDTKIYSTPHVKNEYLGVAEAKVVGDKIDDKNLMCRIEMVPAYNYSEGHRSYHPRERGDVGFIFDIDGLRIYVAGDTEDISEMEVMGCKGVDIAFIPINQPYTMTTDQALHAIEMLNPKIVYPYHYGSTDLQPIINKLGNSEIEVRIRNME